MEKGHVVARVAKGRVALAQHLAPDRQALFVVLQRLRVPPLAAIDNGHAFVAAGGVGVALAQHLALDRQALLVVLQFRVQVGGPVQRLSLRLELERGAARQRASGSERKERAAASVSSER